MCTCVFVVSLFLIGTVIGSYDENQAKIRFYYKSMENYTEAFLEEAHEIFSTTWYNRSKPFVIITHGFAGHPNGPAMKALVTAELNLDESNVALLNWDKKAAMALPGVLNSYVHWAIPNSVQVGTDFAETLLKSIPLGLDINNIHCVGHSLGAHIFGIAGNKLAEVGVRLSWITGLDPATGFDMKPAPLRLNPNSAIYTVALHSDPTKYGSKREIARVNFWPNFKAFGPIIQPGCPVGNHPRFSDEDFCSHNRAWELFIDAIENRGTVIGTHAKNFRTWKKYTKEESEENIVELGVFQPEAIEGNYFLITASEKPFGLGKQGLRL